jgi:DNA-binding response OmpR family regulator
VIVPLADRTPIAPGLHRMPASRTVLVIDDDSDIRDTLRTALEDRGFRVLCAPDGEVGVARALRDRPDLIIVDMMMPRASGFVVLERLKQHHALSIPIIMLTGNDSDHQRAYAESLGVDRYLSKPVRPAILFQTVGQLLPSPIAELAS